jgi:ferredoxin
MKTLILASFGLIGLARAFQVPSVLSSRKKCLSRPVLSQSRQTTRLASVADDKLMDIARKFKLTIFDLEEGIFGLDSKDNAYGIEVVKTNVNVIPGGLGLILTEVAGSNDGRGLVLVSDVTGNALEADPPILVGDVITAIMTPEFKGRTTGLNYDRTVEVIGEAKEATTNGMITLEINRLVERAAITVEVDDGTSVRKIEALAGENLRRLLLRKHTQLYDDRSKRFDMPFATGDCGGEGLCGTCLVNVKQGDELLGPKSMDEELVTRGRPTSWRASCRAVVGPDNQGGTIRLEIRPQSRFADELDPGVKSVII